MTYHELVEKAKEVYEHADASEVRGHLAVQFNVTGEGEGAFYIEITDGNVEVMPFDPVESAAPYTWFCNY